MNVRFALKVGFVALLIVLIGGLLSFFYTNNMLTLEYAQAQREVLSFYVAHHYWSTVVAFMVTYILHTALALPATALLTLVGGFLFGTLPGALYSVVSATSGAVLAFIGVRYLFSGFFYRRFDTKMVQRINKELTYNGIPYLLFLRLVPVAPFFLVNILIALTRVPLVRFVWTTALGILPGDVVYAYAGKQLAHIASLREVFSVPVILIFVVLMATTLVPLFLKKKTP